MRRSVLRQNLFIGIILGFVIGIMSSMDFDDQKAELDHYCEMVGLYKKDPSVGWPDYKNIYDTSCIK